MNFIYRGFCNRTGSVHVLGTLYCRHFQKILIILFHEMRIDTGELYFADCRQYVIIYQTDISGISRNTPFIMSVNFYILFNKFFQNRAFRNLEFPNGHFVLYFFLSSFCILLCWKCFRGLTFLAIIILNSIDHSKFLSSLSDKSHINTPLPCSHPAISKIPFCEYEAPFRRPYT